MGNVGKLERVNVMKNSRKLYFVLFALVVFGLGCQDHGDSAKSSSQNEAFIAEAACGECQFGLDGDSCDLAVRIAGEAYFVDGSGIDDHGDAHADDGFCNAVREASVQGEIVNGRFVAKLFKLLPEGGE